MLEELCAKKEAVRQTVSADTQEPGGEERVIYYHAQLYKRARRKTLKNRREEIRTCKPEAYASLMAAGVKHLAPPEEALERALGSLLGASYPAAAWEEILLPGRV